MQKKEPLKVSQKEKVKESTKKEMTYKEKIKHIKEKFSLINNNAKNYEIRTKESGSEDFAASLNIYLEGTKIRKLVFKVGRANNSGELTEYYYWDGKLFFVFSKLYGPDFEKMEEGKIDIPLRHWENRYYFYNNKLIKWLDSNKKEVSPYSEEYSSAQKEILRESREFYKTAQLPGDRIWNEE